jgi:hypothetical protein
VVQAQTSDSVKAAGVPLRARRLAQVALEHHRAARQKNAREDWS